MTNLTEKTAQLMETLGQGKVEMEVDFMSGNVSINGVVFSIAEQLELVNVAKNDPTFHALLSQINSTPQASEIRSAVKFDGGDFHVDTEKVEKAFGVKLKVADTAPKSVAEAVATSREAVATAKAVTVNNVVNFPTPKDAYTLELEREVEFLRHQNALLLGEDQGLTEEELTFADFTDTTGSAPITRAQVEDIIEDLKDLDVPMYSYVLHRTGNAMILKVNDDEGISYFVAEDYFFANVE